ncbi:MAG: 30S ribosomal protein S16 [Patescibacteria group bacterium]
MLAIRMQRTGRKGHAEFRIVVQDSRRTPTSGVIVAQLGHYSPHSKQIVVDKVKAGFYLEHGAQPSDRVVRLLTTEGIKMPGWVKTTTTKSKTIKHTEKLRKNRKEESTAVASSDESPKTDAPAETEAAPIEQAPPESSVKAEPADEVADEQKQTEASAAEDATSDNIQPEADNDDKLVAEPVAVETDDDDSKESADKKA